ncbi:MAG: Re/Si-specific NAD(P)(+) transhydrogenase subunit alpha [Myxococcales bacterium]|nr:Re/Si-specific NAD(P)(+) transhydrogenase subunit alpha [Myxococcales bacterium]MCB9643497.1 Re/Si-specific NAD(P)(+) transhydrogenase subunit alpha [Myxococcales bacterium]
MPTIFVPKEILHEETRVAASPETVKRLVKTGFQLLVERGAGLESFFSDEEYTEAGASICNDVADGYAKADVILKVQPPRENTLLERHEADMAKEGALWLGFLWPRTERALVDRLAARKVSAFAMDMIPRISRAQSMDALSSQSNIAGYKAVLIAADHLPKMFPLMMTAAGTVKPAKVVIMGAGVAGLQAIATAKRLGAVVEVSDIRPAVKEQVESLGGKFIEVEGAESGEGKGGYAREVSADFLKRQQETIARHVTAADVVITTALVPGKKAPILVTAEMVQAMRPGSVIVDLAVEQGGNCELAEPGKVVVKHGVKIVGHLNVPGRVPYESSQLYARNILFVLQHLYGKKGTELKLDFEDEITRGSIITHDGKLVHEIFAPAKPAEPAKESTPAAKTDAAKADAPKVAADEKAADAPKAEAEKKDEPAKAVDAPKTEDAAKVEAPKAAEAAKVEEATKEAPKTEEKAEAAKEDKAAEKSSEAPAAEASAAKEDAAETKEASASQETAPAAKKED